jgi:hypothetical protein
MALIIGSVGETIQIFSQKAWNPAGDHCNSSADPLVQKSFHDQPPSKVALPVESRSDMIHDVL